MNPNKQIKKQIVGCVKKIIASKIPTIKNFITQKILSKYVMLID